MGFGAEILFMLALGLLLLGPKRLPTILGHVARAKAQLEKASRRYGRPAAPTSFPSRALEGSSGTSGSAT